MNITQNEAESIWCESNRKWINLFLLVSLLSQVFLYSITDYFQYSHKILNYLYLVTPLISLWIFIYFKDRNPISAFTGLVLQMLIYTPSIYPDYFRSLQLLSPKFFDNYYFLVTIILNCTCFYLYSKMTYASDKSHWIFASLGILFVCSFSGFYNSATDTIINFYEFISGRYFKASQIRFDILNGNNLIHLFVFIGVRLCLFTSFLKLRQIILSKREFNYKLATIFESKPISKGVFSFYFFLYRSALFISISGLISMYNWQRHVRFSDLFSIIVTLISLYVFASLYRNLTLLFFKQQGYIPKWLYYGMQIPFFGLLFLVIMLYRPSKLNNMQSIDRAEDVIDNEEMKLPNAIEKNPQKAIETIGVMSAIIYSLTILLLAYSIFILPRTISVTEQCLVILILSSAVYFFIYREFGIYVLMIIQFGAIIQYYVESSPIIFVIISSISVASLVTIYPVFHFDQFTFVPCQSSEEQSETLDNEIEL